MIGATRVPSISMACIIVLGGIDRSIGKGLIPREGWPGRSTFVPLHFRGGRRNVLHPVTDLEHDLNMLDHFGRKQRSGTILRGDKCPEFWESLNRGPNVGYMLSAS
jgi:hypothetical protein